jgi:hypothetical protein
MNNFGDTLPGGMAGPTALLFVVLLATATIFLIRNMNTRLRRLPDRFDQSTDPGKPAPRDPDDAPPA